MDLRKDLLNFSAEEYGTDFREHCLQVYKVYVEMADRISARRLTANSFFLSINTAVITALAYLWLGATPRPPRILVCFVAAAGIVLSFIWYRLIRSYRDHNSGKFKIIHEMEKELPFSAFNAEWTALGRGKNPKLYLQFSRVEMRIPWLFFAVYSLAVLGSVLWDVLLRAVS